MRTWVRAAVAAAVLAGLGYAGVRWQRARAAAADPDRLLGDGQQALARHDAAAAERAADRLRDAGHRQHAALLRGELHFRRQQFDRAEAQLAVVDGDGPLFPRAATVFGWCRLHRGDLRQAEALFRRAAEVAPDHPDPHRGLADVYFALGAMTLAAAEFQQVARLDPADPRPWLALGALLDDVGERVKMATAFDRAAALTAGPAADPELAARARLGLAEALAYTGEPARALAALDELPADRRAAPPAVVARAEVLARLGRTAEAGAALAPVLAAADPPPAALLAGGKLAVADNDPARAVGLLERALAADPASAEASHQLAGAYRLAGRPADAARQDAATARIKADLEEMSRLNDAVWGQPWDAAGRDKLVAVMRRLGKPDIADRWARAAAAAR